MPVSPMAARHHKPYKQAFYRLSAAGIIPVDLQSQRDAATA